MAKLPPTKKWPKASITRPAASLPVWPFSNTTLVEATLRDKRNKVANNKTVGKAAKSRTRLVSSATIKMIMDKAILKVKKRSKINAGKGNTIIERINKINIGPVKIR